MYTNLIKTPKKAPLASIKARTILQYILKQLPQSIVKHISETLSSEEIFNKSIKIYSKALKKSGLTDELKYLSNKVQQLKINEGNAKEIFSSTYSFQKRKGQCG